jgi:hypothetical protein
LQKPGSPLLRNRLATRVAVSSIVLALHASETSAAAVAPAVPVPAAAAAAVAVAAAHATVTPNRVVPGGSSSAHYSQRLVEDAAGRLCARVPAATDFLLGVLGALDGGVDGALHDPVFRIGTLASLQSAVRGWSAATATAAPAAPTQRSRTCR